MKRVAVHIANRLGYYKSEKPPAGIAGLGLRHDRTSVNSARRID